MAWYQDKTCIENPQHLNAFMFCLTHGEDNTQCCKEADLTEYNRLPDSFSECTKLCNGTGPLPMGMNTLLFEQCSNETKPAQVDFKKMMVCNAFKYTPLTTTTTLRSFTQKLECLHTTTIEVDGFKVVDCVHDPVP